MIKLWMNYKWKFLEHCNYNKKRLYKIFFIFNNRGDIIEKIN